MRNYEAYIGAAECYAAVRTEVKDIEILLETLSAQLPDLKRGCEAFVKGAEEIAKARKMNKTLMNNSGTMSDLLEIPKLLDACVRNGHYDEALDLENFIDAKRRKGFIDVLNQFSVFKGTHEIELSREA